METMNRQTASPRVMAESGLQNIHSLLLIFYRTQVSRGSDLWVRLSLSMRGFANLTDVTLADGDTKSILTDNADRAIQGNVAMHVTHPVHMVVKF